MNISNNDRWHSDDWIKNVSELMKPEVKRIHTAYNRHTNNKPYRKAQVLKYEKSEKGRITKKKQWCLRHKRIRHFEIPDEEEELLLEFYLDCPPGYEVDHIVPLSKGGQHRLFNLQLLPKSLNRQKQAKNFKQDCEFPHCLIDNSKYL